MKDMKAKAAVVMCLLALVACGGSPSDPDRENDIPNVQGTYAGTVTVRAYGESAAVTMRMVVAQAGSQVTINASLNIDGETFPIAPAFTTTIGPTGSLESGTMYNVDAGGSAGCGVARTAGASITFASNSAIFTLSMDTTLCGAVSINGTLRK